MPKEISQMASKWVKIKRLIDTINYGITLKEHLFAISQADWKTKLIAKLLGKMKQIFNFKTTNKKLFTQQHISPYIKAFADFNVLV